MDIKLTVIFAYICRKIVSIAKENPGFSRIRDVKLTAVSFTDLCGKIASVRTQPCFPQKLSKTFTVLVMKGTWWLLKGVWLHYHEEMIIF